MRQADSLDWTEKKSINVRNNLKDLIDAPALEKSKL